jgi:hypothetical protein
MTRLRHALSAAALALWCQEALEALTPWRGINARVDQLLDQLTGAVTIVVGVWWVHEYYARLHSQRAQLHERRLKAVFGAMGTACQEAGIAVPEREEPQPNPCVRLVGEDRKTG